MTCPSHPTRPLLCWKLFAWNIFCPPAWQQGDPLSSSSSQLVFACCFAPQDDRDPAARSGFRRRFVIRHSCFPIPCAPYRGSCIVARDCNKLHSVADGAFISLVHSTRQRSSGTRIGLLAMLIISQKQACVTSSFFFYCLLPQPRTC
jgi:hypothetical protein